ncbi:MAG: ZIP family metal transporter [Anaerolineaceae bacterium]
MEPVLSQKPETKNFLRTLGSVLLPLVLLGGVIGVFLATGGAGLNVQPAAPIENIQINRVALRQGEIVMDIQNLSPQPISLAQVVVNDSFWRFEAKPGRELGRLENASVVIPYPWVQGEAYEIILLSSNGVKFIHLIEAATVTKSFNGGNLLSFTLIGLYVGVIPIFLGMFWLPVLRKLGSKWMMFLMALTAGLLVFLGIDATNEALEQAAGLGGAFQGVGLVGIGITAVFLLLMTISGRKTGMVRSESGQRLNLALTIAVGIGLHNLGEGLAIGAAYTAGSAALGAFLVIGFVLQNITEGLGIVAPVLKDRPTLKFLALAGLIGGAPAIVGTWIGGLVTSPALNVLFLSIGAGAVFEVVYEVGKMLKRDVEKHGRPVWIFAGVLSGMLALYVTGMWIK